jgi:hypothetical protein
MPVLLSEVLSNWEVASGCNTAVPAANHQGAV